MTAAETATRHCGACTACCDGWLKITVYGHAVYPGKRCPFSSGHHCTIYDTRPQDPCRAFVCGWLARASPLPEWMRPDRAGVILLAARTSTESPREALEWLTGFATAQGRPLLYRIGEEWYAFGTPAFQTEMHERIGRGEQPWA